MWLSYKGNIMKNALLLSSWFQTSPVIKVSSTNKTNFTSFYSQHISIYTSRKWSLCIIGNLFLLSRKEMRLKGNGNTLVWWGGSCPQPGQAQNVTFSVPFWPNSLLSIFTSTATLRNIIDSIRLVLDFIVLECVGWKQNPEYLSHFQLLASVEDGVAEIQ